MWTSGPHLDRSWFNERWLSFVGLPVERLTGDGWLDSVHPDDVAMVTRRFEAGHPRHEPFELEYRLRRQDGQYRFVIDQARPVIEGGTLRGYVGTATDVTDQKTAAAAQSYLGAILESADEAIISKNLDGVIQWSNAAAERVFGYTASEMVGQSVRMLIPLERQQEEEEILARLRRGQPIDHFETVRVTKDGRRIDVSLTISPVRDRSGAIIGASKIVRDITSERRGSAAQAFLAAIVSSSDDAIIAKDLNGIIQSCNAAAEQLFGYTAKELVGRPVRILIPADRQVEEDEILARIRSGERVDHFETVRLRKDGTPIDMSLTISPIRDAAGTVIGVSKIARDITAQKRAAEEYEASQSWFRVTLASIGDAVIATDVRGGVVFMNPVAEYLTGWRSDAAVGRDCRDIFRVRDAPADPVGQVLADARSTGVAAQGMLVGRDGTLRPIDESGAPIRTRDGQVIGVVLVFRDISERRRVELERQASAAERDRLLDAERAARAEAERASRVKDEFVAMVSHELRTPLNAILGWTQLMMRGRHDAAVVERGLDIVARNTRLQAQLISDLLDISKIISGKLPLDIQSVDLGQLMAEAVETVRQEAQAKGITIDEHLEARIGAVAGDSARLQQVLWNLLTNAVKFTPAGGHIDVTLRARSEGAEITVSDNGAGIRADVLPHIFDRFHQADRSITRRFGGLGLGLSIVKHIVEMHGGSVLAQSPGEGHGATFTIVLPASTPPPETASAAPPPDVDAVSLTGMQILVVEDEPDTRDFVRHLLEAQGATVRTAASAGEALDAFRSEPPDILISDIGLPDVDGFALVHRIRHDPSLHGGRTPAIAMTAYARAEDRTRALRAGYQAHLAKPVESGELLACIASFADLMESPDRPRR
jgi:PAS domain S-box-containing protein